METELLFDTLCETLAEAEAKTLDHTLGIVEADPLVDTVAYALPEAKYKTLSNGLVAVDHDAHVDNFDTLSETEAKTPGDTLMDVAPEVLVERLGQTLLETKSETLGDTLVNLEAKALL